MENLTELRQIKNEILVMDFNYKNVQRIMHHINACKNLFESSSPIPNKEIALYQTNKVIKNEVMKLVVANSDKEVEDAFWEVIDNFKLVLNYIT